MVTGVIKKKMEGKQFGFIAVEGQDRDVFFHADKVTDPAGFDGLNEGDKVSFETQEDNQGRKNAINVTKAA